METPLRAESSGHTEMVAWLNDNQEYFHGPMTDEQRAGVMALERVLGVRRPTVRLWLIAGSAIAASLLLGFAAMLQVQHKLERRLAEQATRERELVDTIKAYASQTEVQIQQGKHLAELLKARDTELAGLRQKLAAAEAARNPMPLEVQPLKPVIVKNDPPNPPGPPKENRPVESIAIAPFNKGAEPSLVEQIRSAERRADALADAPADAPEVVTLRRDILRLRLYAFPQVSSNKTLSKLLDRTTPGKPAVIEAELKAQVARVEQDYSQIPGVNAARRTRLLGILPPGMRAGAVGLYDDTQKYALSRGGQLDPALLDFLIRSRRPNDQLGLIIPATFQLHGDAGKQQWDDLISLAGQGVRIKLIMNYGVDGAAADPVYHQAFRLAKAAGIDVLGVVNCDGGKKPLALALAEVRRWHDYYGPLMGGIFFDNQLREKGEGLDYYKKLYACAKSLNAGWRVVGGPIGDTDDERLKEMGLDIVCRLNDGADPKPRDWEAKYAADRFAVMVRGVAAPEVPGIIERAAGNHFGWVYVTDADGPSVVYTTPAGYLVEEIGVVSALNIKIRGDTPAGVRQGGATKNRGTNKNQ